MDTLAVIAGLKQDTDARDVQTVRNCIDQITTAMVRYLPDDVFMDTMQALSALFAGATGYDGDGAVVGATLVAMDEWQGTLSSN